MSYQEAKVTFHEYYSASDSFLKSGENFFRSLTESIIADSGVKVHHINSRIKSRESCLEKFDKKYRSKFEQDKCQYHIKDHISDLIGIRIVCFYEQDVIEVANTLEKTLEAVEKRKDRFAERDASPNEFGYRAIHLNLKLNSDRSSLVEYRRFKDASFEVQIRTVIQDAWSVLDHKLQYKGHASPQLKRSINALAAVFEQADKNFLQIRDQVNVEQDKAKKKVTEPQNLIAAREESENLPFDAPEVSEGNSTNAVDVISLNELVKVSFKEFSGSLSGASRVLDDIENQSVSLSLLDVSKAITAGLPILQEYQDKTDTFLSLSPLTKLRHCLYYSDKSRFKDALFDHQKLNFDRWIEEKNLK